MKPEREQSKKFLDAARELGADGDAKDFDKTLKELAKAPPPDTVKARKKPQESNKPAK